MSAHERLGWEKEHHPIMRVEMRPAMPSALPRAVGVFRKAGFPVEAYPVDWRTRGAEDALRPFASVGDGLRRSDTAVREWVGLAVYWLSGRSSELFPAPTHERH